MPRIFIVEDYDQLRQTLAGYLAKDGLFEVCGSVASAEAALEQLPAAQADLILIDISLPRMNGLSLVKEVQARSPELPCVVLSGQRSSQYADLARLAGARAYVAKTNLYSLGAILRRVLEGEPFFTADERC